MFTGWARLRPHNAWRDGGLRDLVAYRQRVRDRYWKELPKN